MSHRALRPDTEADRLIRDCVATSKPRSFAVIAGAGSGKTTSLVKVLATIVSYHGRALTSRKQRVACITYTDVASTEIWSEVGKSTLAHVATIHSFLWSFLRPLQRDVAAWARVHTVEKIAAAKDEHAKLGARAIATKARLERDIARYESRLQSLGRVTSFNYGVGSDLERGVLGHDDVIGCASWLFRNRPLSRVLLGQQYPFILVDESQDTFPSVVESLKLVEEHMRGRVCIGFFGDPMQKIYPQGVGAIALNETWITITKRENFRCANRVLAVANAIRKGGDGIQQEPGVGPSEKRRDGFVGVYVNRADERRSQRIALAREHMATATGDSAWRDESGPAVRTLVLVHRMAAKRLGFENLYSAFNDKAPESMKSGLVDGSAWQLRPFLSCALPVCRALAQGDEFGLMNVLRAESPKLAMATAGSTRISPVLKELRQAASELQQLMDSTGTASVRSVLRHLSGSGLAELDERFYGFLEGKLVLESKSSEESDEAKLQSAMARFLETRASELWGFEQYFRGESPFSTQQGIKGAEFERVLVVVDDEEGTHNQFSYEKLFGLKPLSDRDKENLATGADSVLDRTRRLFYVCCTRALEDLAVVIFVPDPAAAFDRIVNTGFFPGATFVGNSDIESWT